MNATESSAIVRRQSVWVRRIGLAALIALFWAVLHYGVDGTVLARGLDRPVVVLAGDGGILAGVVVLVVLAIGGLLGMLLTRGVGEAPGLFAVSLALALWAWHGGTMDEWLKLSNPVPGPPTGAAYRPLLAEYVYWAVVLAAVLGVTQWWMRASGGGKRAGGRERSASAVGMSGQLGGGIFALLVTAAVAAALLFVLAGPRVGHTHRGQVYFAVAASFIIGVVVARRVVTVRGYIWYLPAPLIVGIAGVLLAMAKPALGAGYENINIIPAWGLVRPLPIEMVSVGLLAVLLTCRTAKRLSSEEDRG